LTAPPLGICTGVVEPGVAFGGFGPASAFAWRGSCVGMCGGRPMCAEELPAPECSGCARQRHGVQDGPHGVIGPVIARILSVNLPVVQPVSEPVAQRWTVLRPATEVSPHDPSLPRSVRALAELGPAGTRVTLAVAGDAVGGVLASLAVRAPGVGYAVYTRGEGGAWGFARGAAAGRPCNAGQFAAALRGEVYVPPPPRAAAKAPCPGCGAEVSMTKAGAVYASHKCQTRAIEGRS
jgi:hypothetical protein